jgi:predicted phage terminase large subunit-like protein
MATKQEVIDLCSGSLFAFAKLLNPHYQYGDVHEEVFSWLQNPTPGNLRQLLLLPRGHLKSHCIAVYCVWRITFKPWVSIIYVSASEDLAKDQIYAIKNMMTSETYTRYWPEMLQPEESKREQWSAYSFNVDHPERKRRGVRDHTLIVKTVKSNSIGLHCDELILDDVVVPQFADTAVGRSEINRSMAQFVSVLNAGGSIKAVGTRYHPEDAYQGFIDSEYAVWDEEKKTFVGTRKLWDVFEKQVENAGDGTGAFLWPRSVEPSSGESYGFDPGVLAIIRADYESKGQRVQYYCQYYNDPNAIDTQRISRGSFQYYDRARCKVVGGSAVFKDTKLNVFAAMDVAWTDNTSSDYTAISVIGVDHDSNIYILDLVQFKTVDFAEFYNEVISLHYKWGFKKIRVETNAGGQFVAQELERLIRQNGNVLAVEGKSTQKQAGNKRERKAATLEWRYADKKVWHYRGGLTSELEDQIVLDRPRHDDIVDSFVAAIEICKPPGKRVTNIVNINETNLYYDRKYGGRRGRVA